MRIKPGQLGRWPFVVVSELDMVAPAGGCIFNYQAEISVLKPVFVYYLAVHILLPKYIAGLCLPKAKVFE